MLDIPNLPDLLGAQNSQKNKIPTVSQIKVVFSLPENQKMTRSMLNPFFLVIYNLLFSGTIIMAEYDRVACGLELVSRGQFLKPNTTSQSCGSESGFLSRNRIRFLSSDPVFGPTLDPKVL